MSDHALLVVIAVAAVLAAICAWWTGLTARKIYVLMWDRAFGKPPPD